MRNTIMTVAVVIVALLANCPTWADVRNPDFEDSPNGDWKALDQTCCAGVGSGSCVCGSGTTPPQPHVFIRYSDANHCRVLEIAPYGGGECFSNYGVAQCDICVPDYTPPNPTALTMQLRFDAKGASAAWGNCGKFAVNFGWSGGSAGRVVPFTTSWVTYTIAIPVGSTAGATDGFVGFSTCGLDVFTSILVDNVHLCLVDGGTTNLNTSSCQDCDIFCSCGLCDIVGKCPFSGFPNVCTCGTTTQQCDLYRECTCEGELADAVQLLRDVLHQWGNRGMPRGDLVRDGVVDEKDLLEAMSRVADEGHSVEK